MTQYFDYRAPAKSPPNEPIVPGKYFALPKKPKGNKKRYEVIFIH
ncbi:MAG: hypothetical protein CM15mP29_0220 [Alphaproteobacteria bacterium]|nr:MAG: hypothetical protein CM15mP29_0220 [Alphaproteobacteria bacterium]